MSLGENSTNKKNKHVLISNHCMSSVPDNGHTNDLLLNKLCTDIIYNI